jgi:hypothetical protein
VKDKISELATNSKKCSSRDHYRGTCEFKDYRNRSNLVKKENCDLLADSHNILNMSLSLHRAHVIIASATQHYHAYMPYLATFSCVLLYWCIRWVSIISETGATICTAVVVARHNSR